MSDPSDNLRRRRLRFLKRRRNKDRVAAMSVIEHLRELRRRLIFSLAAFVVISGFANNNPGPGLTDVFRGLSAFEWVMLVIGVILLLGYSANCAVIMAEQFPAEVRATGIGLPYALAVAVFGGTAPYITTWMNTSGYGGLVWVYCSIAAAIGVAVYLTMPETKGKALD